MIPYNRVTVNLSSSVFRAEALTVGKKTVTLSVCLSVCPSLSVGKWSVEQLKENKVPGDQGLVLKSRAKHHAIAAPLDKPFVFQDEPLVIQ